MKLFADALFNLGYILVFPGLLYCFICGLLLSGIERKLSAGWKRKAGPIIQPFYDFFRLCGKETIVPFAANKTGFLLSPIIGYASLIVLQLFIPLSSFTAFRGSADIIVVLYMLLVPEICEITGSIFSGSPHAEKWFPQKINRMISCEISLALVLLSAARCVGRSMGSGVVFSLSEIAEYQAKNGSLIGRFCMVFAAIAMILTIPGIIGSRPFHDDEAIFSEYDGILLAIYKLCRAGKLFTMTSLFCSLFLAGSGTGIVLIDAVVFLIISVLLTGCIALLEAVLCKIRSEKLIITYVLAVFVIAGIGFVLAWVGA